MKRHTVLLLAAVVGAVAVAAQGAPAAKPLGPPGGLPPNLPKNGLVAFWTADGHDKDSLGKHHGTIQGNVEYTTGRHGKAKGAFRFDGKSGFVKVPDRAELDTDFAFSLAAWVNPTAYKDRNGHRGWIICKYYTSTPGGHADYALAVTEGGCLELIVAENPTKIGKYQYLNSRAVVPKNKWTHVAATFDRGVMKLYINGELVANIVSKTVKRTDPDEYVHDDVHIGGLWNNRYIFTGAIDEVGIWNRALSGGEIAAVAELPPELPAYLPRKDLVAFWTGDGHARDSAGKNHGTLQGNVTYTADRHGKAEGAFLLTDKKGVVIIPDSDALDTDDAFTLAAWIKPKRYRDRDDKHGTYSSIIRKQFSSGSVDYVLSINSAGVPSLSVANKAGGSYAGDAVGSNATAPKNVWTHLAATFDRGRMKIYVNGELKGSHTSKLKHTGKGEYEHDEVTIGAYWDGHSYRFDGAIDEVGIWGRALTPDEIAAVAGPMAGMHVVRVAGVDRVEMNDTSVLRGGIQNKQFTVATAFGKLAVPAGKVVGILPAPKPKTATTQPASSPAGPFVHLLLADGQVVTGHLSAREILLATDRGQAMKIPIGKVRQCGYQITKAKPAEAAVSAPAVTLRSRQKLSIADNNLSLQFQAEWGKVALPIGSVLRVEVADWEGTRHKAYFANGSVLTGTLPQKLKLKLALGPELSVEPGQVWGIAGTAKPVKPAGATMLLRSGDALVGRFADKMLTVKTTSGDVKVYAGGIASMQFEAKKPTAVTLRTWDNKVIKGTPADASVAFEIAPGGPAFKVPAAGIANVTQPDASPPPETLKEIEKLIAQLGAESYVDREKAQKDLIAMGKSIVPILKKHLNNPDPEIRQRLEQIIKTLGG